MIDTKFIYAMAEADARKKIREWNSDKKNFKILSCTPGQKGDKGYEVHYSYDEDEEVE